MSQWGGKPAQKSNTDKNCPAVQVKSTRHTASESERQSHKAVKNDKNMQKYWPTKKRTSSDVGETGKRWVPAGQAKKNSKKKNFTGMYSNERTNDCESWCYRCNPLTWNWQKASLTGMYSRYCCRPIGSRTTSVFHQSRLLRSLR